MLIRSDGDHLIADAVNEDIDHALETELEADAAAQNEGRLPTIEEENVQDQELWLTVDTYFADEQEKFDPKDLEEAIYAIISDTSKDHYYKNDAPLIPAYVPPQFDNSAQAIFMFQHYLTANLPTETYGRPHAFDETGNECIEIAFSRGMAKCMINDEHMTQDDVCVLKIYATSTGKKTVIERDTDLLTPQEMQDNKLEISAAILEELTSWTKYKTFVRHPRGQGKQNIMTSRFVAKFKWVSDADGNRRRIIRMRLTIRGFQDWFAHLDENFSPTASRLSQRMICSEAACHPEGILVTIDVEKAFLQGLTYKQRNPGGDRRARKRHPLQPPAWQRSASEEAAWVRRFRRALRMPSSSSPRNRNQGSTSCILHETV